MQATNSDARSAHVVRRSHVERLLDAVGYPVQAPEAAQSFTLLVDGGEIVASEAGGSLRLMCRLTDDAAELPRLAGFSAGRMLLEDAVLSCDQTGAFLWQDIDGGADEWALRRGFESFADSCDWWRARLGQDGDEHAPQFPEMMIRP